jgi:hypothetical protein
MCLSSRYGRGINRRITVQAHLKNADPTRTITKAKMAGHVAKLVEHLPSKHKVLSSNSSIRIPPPKKRRNLGRDKIFWLDVKSSQ